MPETGLAIYPTMPAEPDVAEAEVYPSNPSNTSPWSLQGCQQNFIGPSSHYHFHMAHGVEMPTKKGELEWPQPGDNHWDFGAFEKALEEPPALEASPLYKALTGKVIELDEEVVEKV